MKLSDWKLTTWYLIFCCMVFNWGNILFGISIMNSVVWLGKLTGTIIFEPLLERVGFKKTVLVGAFAQIIGVIIEITAKEWIQFTVGRVLTYAAVGIIETTVPTYEAELAPAPLRGFFAGNVQVFVHIGAIWGSGMSRAFADEMGPRGWKIPVGVQMIPSVLLLILIPFCIESPRWLLSHGQKEKAIISLNKIRPAHQEEDGTTVAEAETIEQAIQESREIGEGQWLDLFRKSHRRQAWICAMMFFFNQTTGQQFANVYGPSFYRAMGLNNEDIFTYTILIPVVGLAGCTIAVCLTDIVGRRPLTYIGAALAVLFSALIAAIGSDPSSSTDAVKSNVVVASVMLLNGVCKFGVSSQCYLVASEIGGTQMRKKMLAWATFNDVIFAFIVTFCIPYLQDGPAIQLGAEVGYIFMGAAIIAFFWSIFFLPELRGRSLEEVDELFERKLWAWQFNKAESRGLGAEIARIEEGAHANFQIKPTSRFQEKVTDP
ncbi:hypothetical protein I302_108989 [Kwoniella bestiolae CBS 10118]|uniref:Major facilitator superfamily (MFS) profile domain-containing protein n=1 Tax=Kwoniella bestiolae CBS 10118 TaxID=1296100 RepID=A0AAJ8MBH7_9TREE